jgi:Arc/MetJ-type ribon-helix-helix transcriptional regulator
VNIPRQIYDELEAKIIGTSFKSVSDYVTSVLKQFLGKSDVEDSGKTLGLSKEDEEDIKKKLQALGYL